MMPRPRFWHGLGAAMQRRGTAAGRSSPRRHAEAERPDHLFWRPVRTIARARVLLALGAAVVVYVDPSLPPGGEWYHLAAADGNLLLAIIYALVVWRLVSAPAPPVYLPRLTIWLDVLIGAALIGSTGAHQSPFFLWNVFTLVSAGLQSGWRTALRVCLAQMVLYLYVSLYLPDLGRSEFALDVFLVRTLYLFAIALVLAHMGQRLLEQNRMLANLHRAATHMSAGRSTADILGRAADSLTDLLEAERVAAAVWDDGSTAPRSVFVNMDREQGECLLRLARDLVAAAPQDSAPWSYVGSAAENSDRFGAADGALAGVRSLLITRLPADRGVLVACNRLGTPGLSASDRELAELLAAQAGPLLETARLQEQRRQYAGREERRRIASELHDRLIQTLASIDLRALTCRAAWQRREWEALGEELRTLKQLAEEALDEARGAIHELAPVRLRQIGLAAHLQDSIRRFEERGGAQVAASIDLEGPEIPEETALLVISLVREGLNNIRKHAHACGVTLAVSQSGDEIAFRLADDGVGFDAAAHPLPHPPAGHYGLAYLRERITAVGGELRVTSRPGEGTVLSGRVPLLTEERLASLLSPAKQ